MPLTPTERSRRCRERQKQRDYRLAPDHKLLGELYRRGLLRVEPVAGAGQEQPSGEDARQDVSV